MMLNLIPKLKHDHDIILALLDLPSLHLNRPVLNHLLANYSLCARRLKMNYQESEVQPMDNLNLNHNQHSKVPRKGRRLRKELSPD